jgi:TetR/AcrR family transcriptional repressor of nem operon
MKENTRHRILETGAEIIHLKGFHHTGIQEILNTAGVPKGSFYNYFKSKEDFGLQVIDYYVDFFSMISGEILDEKTLSPLAKIDKLLKWFIDFFKSKDYAYGCPIGNLAQEMGDLSPEFREKLKMAIDAMIDLYAGLLTEAQGSGEVSKGLDVREAARFIVSSWHGALMHMKAVKGAHPLENHRLFILEYVLRL